MTECEHGHPRPGLCPLCRKRERDRFNPPPRMRAPEPTRRVPKPIYFDAWVEEAREAHHRETHG